MANITSKLAVCGSVAIVLLMMFSAFPVNAEETSESIGDIEVTSGTDDELPGIWAWDGTKCVLEIYGNVTTGLIKVTLSDDACDGTVIIKGIVTLAKHSSLVTWTTSHNMTITGGGTIVAERSCIYMRSPTSNSSNETPDLILDNMSTDFADGYFCTINNSLGSVAIKNCKSIKMIRSNSSEQSAPYPVINAKEKIIIENSNIDLKNLHRTLLMKTGSGITLPFSPTSNFAFTNPDGSTYWENGVTTEINGLTEGCALSMHAYDDGKLPIAIGIFVALLAIVVVGTYVFFKK